MASVEQIPQLPLQRKKPRREYLLESGMAVGGALIITGIIAVFHLYPTIPNISVIYLLLILFLASTRGFYAASLAALAALLSFDFFLVPPLYTLAIARWEEWLALLVFLVTALLTSQLAAQARRSIEQARLHEREARILYEVGRVLNSTPRLDEQLDTIVLALVRVFAAWGVRECALLLPDSEGALTVQTDAPIRVEHFSLSPDEWDMAQDVMTRGVARESGQTSAFLGGRQELLRLLPLKTADRTIGVLCLRLESGASWFASEQWIQKTQALPTEQSIFFWTFLDAVIMKIEQARLREDTTTKDV